MSAGIKVQVMGMNRSILADLRLGRIECCYFPSWVIYHAAFEPSEGVV
jgi:hypothetical protein